MSTIRFQDDDGETEDIGDVDAHFYEKQLPPQSPFDDGSHAFALATARAKDRARIQLVRAVRKADEEAHATGFGFGLAGMDRGIIIKRSIDGVDGAPDNDIKL